MDLTVRPTYSDMEVRDDGAACVFSEERGDKSAERAELAGARQISKNMKNDAYLLSR